MNAMELPLVIFTVLSQGAVGLVALTAARQWAAGGGGDLSPAPRTAWLAAMALLAVGAFAALFHLGHMGGAVRTLANLESAWLSREGLALGATGALLLAGYLSPGLRARGAATAAAALGVAAVLVTSMTYAPAGFPALNNALPGVFFLLTAAVLGPALAAPFLPDAHQPAAMRALRAALLVSLVINLVVPCVWLSGGTVMRLTGEAFLTAPLYWLRMALLAGSYALARGGRMPAWMLPLLAVQELLGRALFFMLPVHASVNIGNPF